ncbi:3',5'-cyclic-AMP phosphodiesterase [Aequoribacter sp.]|jgi:Icc protein|uniref:3',5'-cyclic-AMP phosphodiesterase n=1 Tax=Aequoribacter sp. TaxID=2847771 RepID=UPI003F69B11A
MTSLLDTIVIEHDPAQAVDVLQITDTHLGVEPNTPLLSMDTDDSLLAVLDLAGKVLPAPALMLATGDLSDQGALNAYFRLRDYTRSVCQHQFWLLGNHDHAETLRRATDDNKDLIRNDIRVGAWQIVMLNSQIPGQVGGRLGPRQLALLEEALQAGADAGLNTLVCLHHQPEPVGSAWIDSQAVLDADEMFAVIEQYPNAKAVLWGHVHQEVDYLRKSVRMLATPSTCIQFARHSDDFKVDDLPPGFRHLQLLPDGSINTQVYRVTDRSFTVDLGSSGYL